MINALTFALQSHAVTQHLEDKPRKALQGVHAVWLLGGYLYEAIHLVDDLSTRYGRESRFKRLDQFARNIRPYRELLAEFNLSPGFSMDWGGETTRKQIALLPNSTLYHQPETVDDGLIYPGIFRLDIQYLEEVTSDHATEDELEDLIRHGVQTYAQQFIEAGIEFIGTKPGRQPESEDLPKAAPPIAVAVGFASGPAKFEPELPEPDFRMGLVLGVDNPECHARVPVCFGGDFDPDACEV